MSSRSTRRYELGAVLAGLAVGLAMLVPAAGAGAQIVAPASAPAATPDVGGQTIYNDASGLCLDMTNESTSQRASTHSPNSIPVMGEPSKNGRS
jgi:hypothetical protein